MSLTTYSVHMNSVYMHMEIYACTCTMYIYVYIHVHSTLGLKKDKVSIAKHSQVIIYSHVHVFK